MARRPAGRRAVTRGRHDHEPGSARNAPRDRRRLLRPGAGAERDVRVPVFRARPRTSHPGRPRLRPRSRGSRPANASTSGPTCSATTSVAATWIAARPAGRVVHRAACLLCKTENLAREAASRRPPPVRAIPRPSRTKSSSPSSFRRRQPRPRPQLGDLELGSGRLEPSEAPTSTNDCSCAGHRTT